MTATDRSLTELLLSDIAAIRTAEALQTWGIRRAVEIRDSGCRDEIAQAYKARMEELKEAPKCQEPIKPA